MKIKQLLEAEEIEEAGEIEEVSQERQKQYVLILAFCVVLVTISACIWVASIAYAQGVSAGGTQGYTQGQRSGYATGYNDGKTAAVSSQAVTATTVSGGQINQGVQIEAVRIFMELNNLGCHRSADGSFIVRLVPSKANDFKFACG